jgi:hypothetical protein
MPRWHRWRLFQIFSNTGRVRREHPQRRVLSLERWRGNDRRAQMHNSTCFLFTEAAVVSEGEQTCFVVFNRSGLSQRFSWQGPVRGETGLYRPLSAGAVSVWASRCAPSPAHLPWARVAWRSNHGAQHCALDREMSCGHYAEAEQICCVVRKLIRLCPVS